MELTSLSRANGSEGWIRLRGPAGAASDLRMREARSMAEEALPEKFDLPAWELHEDVARRLRRSGIPVGKDGSVAHLSPRAWADLSGGRSPEDFRRLAWAFSVLGAVVEGVAVPEELLPFVKSHGQRFAHLELPALLEALDLLTCYRGDGFALLIRLP